LPSGLIDAVQQFAARQEILVAFDFDGVLAPIVTHPDDARPLPAASAALQRLAGGTGVHLALVSGRTLGDLHRLADPPPAVWLVGSHGAQFTEAFAQVGPSRTGTKAGIASGDDAPPGMDEQVPGMDEQSQALLARVVSALEQISARHRETFVERKPAGAVLHTRQAPRNAARRATEEALSGPSTWAGVYLTRGKEIVDLSVVDVNKGVALNALRGRVGLAPRGGGVLYIGDDITDERAFAVLDDDRGDITVKVGDSPTIARHRIDVPGRVAALLGYLADLRGC
jgi:HAD superfamily hydrolase (TIGR01484 family)